MIRGEKMQLRFWVERGTKWHILMITNSSSLFPNLDYFQPTTCSMGMDWFPGIIKMKKRRTAVGAGSTSWKMFGKKNSRYWNSPVRDYWWWTVYIRLFPGTADISDYFLPSWDFSWRRFNYWTIFPANIPLPRAPHCFAPWRKDKLINRALPRPSSSFIIQIFTSSSLSGKVFRLYPDFPSFLKNDCLQILSVLMFNNRKHNTADVFDLEKLFVTVDANTARLLNNSYELTIFLDKIAKVDLFYLTSKC